MSSRLQKKYCVQVSPQTSQPFSRAARDRLDRLLARDVHDVERRAREVCELDRAIRRLSFGFWRACERVVERLRVTGLESLLHENVDHVAVLGVHHHERTRLRRDLHRAEERLVVDHQRALVGHEELVRRDALVGQRGELLERPAVLEIGDGHVVAHVDHLLAVRLSAPLLEGLCERVPLGLDDEVDVARGAAERCGSLPGFDVVDRHRSAERHVEMRVRIDAARQHVLARRVDHLVGLHVERLADQGDRLVVDVEIRDVVVGRGDDATIANQNRHHASSIFGFGAAASAAPKRGSGVTCRLRSG